jgi:hypothetical protein
MTGAVSTAISPGAAGNQATLPVGRTVHDVVLVADATDGDQTHRVESDLASISDDPAGSRGAASTPRAAIAVALGVP